MTIKLLDPKVVSLIAAGEVVERPASVVKELVENSLDAGSSQISVEARGGGVGLIRVTDNGAGIPPEEVELAFNRYATSKIGNLEDLKSISSLGFRGEALPSIAAMAEVDIVTCAASESAGNYLNLRDGAIVARGSRGRSQGTTVTVRNLFRKVPARLKFLKSSATENSHIANVVSQYALAFPAVKFALFIDGRAALRTPGSGQLIDSVTQVYGLEIARNMLEIGGGDKEWASGIATSSLSVTGMVGSPAVSRSNRGYLSLFVNRRWISSRLLAWAVEEAYHGLLMQGKHPVAIINISLPPEEVDVNVHPTKTEVKFQNEHAVFGAVQKAVRRALIELAPVPKIEEVATTYGAPSVTRPLLGTSPPGGARPKTLPAISQTPAVSLPVLRILGQLLSSYIIAEGPDGLYLIDQHAAHERILLEKIEHQRLQQEIEVQGLLEPVTFEVNPKQEEVLKSHSEDLAEFGFSIESFGDRTYLVRAVPALLYQDKPTRGGAVSTAFDYDDVKNASPTSKYGTYIEEGVWENIAYFLKETLPTAEKAGVVITFHPDDPPISPIQGFPRPLRSVEAFDRLLEIVPSENIGLNFCQGCFAEMGVDVPAAIRHFGKKKKIFFAHFRNIIGSVKEPGGFQEIFHDDPAGTVDMFEAMKAYYEVSFEGPMRPDHAPRMEFDNRISGGVPGYLLLGKVFAIGYMKGLAESIEKTGY